MLGWIKKNYFAERGFGIIVPDDGGEDVFLHHRALRKAGIDNLEYRERISFDVVTDHRGMKAVNIERLHLKQSNEGGSATWW